MSNPTTAATDGTGSPDPRERHPGTYRVGSSWAGRTIARVGSFPPDAKGRRPDDQLIAHVDSTAPDGWAERVCGLLNAEPRLKAAVDLLEYALHLRKHGERAPGGNETWAEFDRRCETLLRSAVGGDAPPDPPSLPVSAPEPSVGGSGRPGGAQTLSGDDLTCPCMPGWPPHRHVFVTREHVPGRCPDMDHLADQERFQVKAIPGGEDADSVLLSCDRCTWTFDLDDPTTLAEVTRRAGSHTDARCTPRG